MRETVIVGKRISVQPNALLTMDRPLGRRGAFVGELEMRVSIFASSMYYVAFRRRWRVLLQWSKHMCFAECGRNLPRLPSGAHHHV